MKRIDIYHIYWGTAGSAGLYIDEIYNTLNGKGFTQKIFVNYYYPFLYGNKVFFRFTEIGYGRFFKFRGIIRYLELIKALLYILFFSIFDRPRIINFSLTGSFTIIRSFLWLEKRVVGSKIVITCHDVRPLASEHQADSTEVRKRKKILDMADHLLVHNHFSKTELKDCFSIDVKKTISHPFPIMDLSKIVSCNVGCEIEKSDFLFIGKIRRGKGVDILLKAWDGFHRKYPDAKLRIAGDLTSSIVINWEKYKNRDDISLYLHFLSDEEYFNIIKATKYVVMPYNEGTNSGVISTVLSLRANVITSDLEMFKENCLVDRDLIFKSSDVESLAKTLSIAYMKKEFIKDLDSLINDYRKLFNIEVTECYKNLLNMA